MLDFYSQTKQHPHPMFSDVSVFYVRDVPVVHFQVFPSQSGYILLECISAVDEGHGYGSMALDWFCALADKYQVEIEGEITPFRGSRMDGQDLATWYQRHGFTVSEENISRKPAPTSKEPLKKTKAKR